MVVENGLIMHFFFLHVVTRTHWSKHEPMRVLLLFLNRRDGNHPHQDGHLGILNENNFGGENHFLREFVMMSSIRNEVLRHIILYELILIRLLTVNGLKS